MKPQLSIAIIFVIGCASGAVVSQLAVPPVRAGTNPTRWEYFCSSAAPGSIQSDLNKMRIEGWELVNGFVSRFDGQVGGGVNSYAADAYAFCFKRALP
jgi:hypothetical protein